MLNDKLNFPILVTGSHRSGTTIVGNLLSRNKNIGYIREPLNEGFGLEEVERPFPYVHFDTANNVFYEKLFEKLLSGRAKFKVTTANAEDSFLKKVAHKIIRSNSQWQYKKAMWNPLVDTLLIKDPLAVLASDWLSKRFDMRVVAMVRHPAAFVSSLKRLKWTFDFNNFFRQPLLMQRHLDNVLKGVDIHRKSNIEQWSFLWVCINRVLREYVKANENFFLIKHEELSIKPVEMFRYLYKELELQFKDDIVEAIHKQMGRGNPVEAGEGQVFQLHRDSRNVVEVWKHRLTEEELTTIEQITRPLAEDYYSYDNWEL